MTIPMAHIREPVASGRYPVALPQRPPTCRRWPNSVIDTPQMKSSLRLLMRWHLRPEHGSELHDLRVIDSASSANDDRAELAIGSLK
jgi:hypothetical protein